MKILVTGASGYLGRGIVKCLLDQNVEVIAIGHNKNNLDPRAIYLEKDIFTLVDPFVACHKPDIVLHLAWEDSFIHNAPSHLEHLPKHMCFLEQMAKGGVKMLSVMGSMHEVGFFEGCIHEDTPCNPSTRYGIAKDTLRRFMELICTENKVIFQWLRGFYIVGNTPEGSSVFSKLVAAENRGDKNFPFTSGENQFDFLDYDEFCSQTAAAISQTEIGGIIHICSGHPEKLKDRMEQFIRENDFQIRLDYGKYPDRPYDSKAVWGDDRKIKNILRGIKNGIN